MANIMAPANAGDLVVVSAYDPVTEEASSFEPQLGSHGGIGGAQMEPFVLYPSDLEPTAEPVMLVGVDELRWTIDRWLAQAQAEDAQAHIGDEVCVTTAVEGAAGEVCARRDRFGALWTVELTDTADDGRPVAARISLDVVEAPDETATVENDGGAGPTVGSDGRFSPRVGSALGDVSLEICVNVRFGPDRCRTESATLPQLTAQGNPSQLRRLEELVFEMPLEEFVAERARAGHSGIDASFDWSSDGCSAGPFRELLEDRLEEACLRHDFAYRNFGQLFLDPTDDVRGRVDERLAADVTGLGQGSLAGGVQDTLRRFGAPVFYGDDLAALWDVPDFIVSRFGLDAEDAASDVRPIALPAVDGIEWEREYEGYGATALDSDIAPLAIDVLLDAIDADISRFGARGADARDIDSGERSGAYLALRVDGADRESMEHAVLAWVAALLDMPEAPVEDASIGGLDVLVVAPGEGTEPVYIHTIGDTVHLISTPEDEAARILAALP